MSAHNPALAQELQRAMLQGFEAADAGLIQDCLFSQPPVPELRERLFCQGADVAEAASRQVAGWTCFAPMPWAMPKLLVIGGAADYFVPAGDVRMTALYYGVLPVIVKDGAHLLMLDANWLEAAKPIAGWLKEAFG